MPPSAFTSSEKSLIKTVLSSSSTKIITATPARVYVAHPTPDKWYYAGFEGALVLVREGANLFYFRLVDLKVCTRHSSKTPGQVVWDHELYEDFYFYEDKPYFHTFAGDLYKKVQNRANSSGFGFAKKLTSFMGSSSSSSDKERTTKTMDTHDTQISEPQWNGLVEQLGSMGVSESDIKNNEGFLRDLLGMRERNQTTVSASTEKESLAPPVTSVVPMRNAPPPPPSAPPSGPSALPPVASRPAATSVAPPPPARPDAGARNAPPVPPPPPSSGGGRVPPPVPTRTGATSRGPPPPPPARPGASTTGGGIRVPPPPPPPPAAIGAGAPPPPPPPPPPPAPAMGAGGAPPPPPPPPAPVMGAGAPPQPPPPAAPSAAPSALNGMPAPQPGRDALLASIQGKSVKDLKKTDPNAPPPRPAMSAPAGEADPPAGSTGGAGGGDLASALASALSKRKGNMGGSDDEESDDDW
ncbi:hypothetical protein MCAP1_001763 [Malassezia caprae]|uniref:Proline-rich protein LAS17 n=1 Tax=Malassezia caprae TaxID=1381934 RepID=A0AAF0EA56_9BASI|nr:hypothetical protein MCAP1_001763 [Malassezia caprae]